MLLRIAVVLCESPKIFFGQDRSGVAWWVVLFGFVCAQDFVVVFVESLDEGGRVGVVVCEEVGARGKEEIGLLASRRRKGSDLGFWCCGVASPFCADGIRIII